MEKYTLKELGDFEEGCIVRFDDVYFSDDGTLSISDSIWNNEFCTPFVLLDGDKVVTDNDTIQKYMIWHNSQIYNSVEYRLKWISAYSSKDLLNHLYKISKFKEEIDSLMMKFDRNI